MIDRTHKVAWAAGFLDGEGAFCLSLTYRKGTNDHLRQPRVIATQTNIKPIIELQDLFGGKLYDSPRRKTMAGNQIWVWEESGKRVAPILEELIPFLVLKRDEAICVRNYALLIGGPGQRVTTDVRQQRASVASEFDIARLRQ